MTWTANNGHLDATKVLLDRGADIEHRSNDAKTPLLWAAMWGHLEVVQLLVERGANINVHDHDGMTAIMLATKGGHIHVVEYLIEKGAHVYTKNFYIGTALTIAKVKGYTDLENLLEQFFPEELTTNPYLLVMYHMYNAVLRRYKLFLRAVRYYTGLSPTLDMTEDEL